MRMIVKKKVRDLEIDDTFNGWIVKGGPQYSEPHKVWIVIADPPSGLRQTIEWDDGDIELEVWDK